MKTLMTMCVRPFSHYGWQRQNLAQVDSAHLRCLVCLPLSQQVSLFKDQLLQPLFRQIVELHLKCKWLCCHRLI